MKTAKIFIICIAIVVLGVVTGLTVWAWPLLTKFWTEMVVPNKEIVVFGTFALITFGLATRKWKLWFKLLLGTILLSSASTISGTSLTDICAQGAYQVVVCLFLIISFLVILYKKRKITEEAKGGVSKKPKLSTVVKDKVDEVITKIGGKEKGGTKRIALYVIIAMVAGFVLLPFIMQVVNPIWRLVFLPYHDYIFLILIAAASVVLAIKLKSIILKVLIFILSMSALSMCYGITFVGLFANPWYQLLATVFVTLVLVFHEVRSENRNYWRIRALWRQDFDNCYDRKRYNCTEEGEIKLRKMQTIRLWCSSLLLIILIIFLLAVDLKINKDQRWILFCCTTIVAIIWWCSGWWGEDGPVSSFSRHHLSTSAIFGVMIISLASILFFINKEADYSLFTRTLHEVETVANTKPATVVSNVPAVLSESAGEKSVAEKFLHQNNCERNFSLAQKTDIMFPGAVVTIAGSAQVKKDSRGNCSVRLGAQFDDSFSFTTRNDNPAFIVKTKEGNMNIPARSTIEFESSVMTAYFAVPLSVNN
jgi:hypothetical protein